MFFVHLFYFDFFLLKKSNNKVKIRKNHLKNDFLIHKKAFCIIWSYELLQDRYCWIFIYLLIYYVYLNFYLFTYKIKNRLLHCLESVIIFLIEPKICVVILYGDGGRGRWAEIVQVIKPNSCSFGKLCTVQV